MTAHDWNLDDENMIQSLDENHKRADDADAILAMIGEMRREYAEPSELVRTSIFLKKKDKAKLQRLAKDMRVPYQVFTRDLLSRMLEHV